MPALPSWLVKIVRVAIKRPSDAQIRAVRVAFAATLAYALVAAHGRYALLPASLSAYDSAAQWALLALAFPSLWTGLTGKCCAKKKTVQLGQLVLAVVLFTLGWTMRAPATAEVVTVPEPKAVAAQAATGAVRTVSFADAAQGKTSAPATSGEAVAFDRAVDALAAKAPVAPLPVGLWLSLLAWLPLVAGITGKMVTSKCLKYGEIITKVRV